MGISVLHAPHEDDYAQARKNTFLDSYLVVYLGFLEVNDSAGHAHA